MNRDLVISIDQGLKAQTEYILNEIGLDISTAVTIFLKQVVRQEKIPFELSAERSLNAETMEAIMEAERMLNDPDTEYYTNIDEMLEDLKNDAE